MWLIANKRIKKRYWKPRNIQPNGRQEISIIHPIGTYIWSTGGVFYI